MIAARKEMDSSRLRRFLGFLDLDPENLGLIAEAAGAAMDEGDAAAAMRLLDRYAALAPLPTDPLNLAALAAIGEGRSRRRPPRIGQAGMPRLGDRAAPPILTCRGPADPAIR